MEAKAFTSLGIWKSWEEMEESITIQELRWMLDSIYEEEDKRFRFEAAIHNIKLEEEPNQEFDDVKRRAAAKRRGMSEEQLHFDELGIDYETTGM